MKELTDFRAFSLLEITQNCQVAARHKHIATSSFQFGMYYSSALYQQLVFLHFGRITKLRLPSQK